MANFAINQTVMYQGRPAQVCAVRDDGAVRLLLDGNELDGWVTDLAPADEPAGAAAVTPASLGASAVRKIDELQLELATLRTRNDELQAEVASLRARAPD